MAATTIDSLVVTLGLDSSNFDKGAKSLEGNLKKASVNAEATGKRIQESGTKAAEFFGQMQKAAIKFFAVLTVGRGLSDFTRTVIGTGAQLSRVSERIGESADTLSRWQGAVRQSGGTAEGFLSTVQGISESLTQLKLDPASSPLLKYINQLQLSLADVDNNAKPITQIISDIADSANKLIANPADRYNILRAIGLDEGTTNLALKGSAERQRLLANQKGFSDADAKAAREAQEKWEGVQLRIERLTQEIVIKLIPSFEKLTKVMEEFATLAVPQLVTVWKWLDKIDRILAGWGDRIQVQLPKFESPTSQKIFDQVVRSTPVPKIAGFIDSQINDEQRNELAKAKDKAAKYFGLDQESSKSPVSNGIIDRFMRIISGHKKNNPEYFDLSDLPALKNNENSSSGENRDLPRAQRNNNPGNLEFRGQAGAVPEPGEGRFAKFNSMREGVAAYVRQLQLDASRGYNTVRELISKYSPPSENDTEAYIDAITKKLGVNENEPLDLSDVGTLRDLIRGISKQEGYGGISDNDIMSGLNLAGVRGAQQQAPNMTIGEVKVYTQAQDANGIVRDMRGALNRQADTGMR